MERSLTYRAHRRCRLPTPNDNPLGLGPRDHDGSNSGSVADASYDAVGSDPYTTGEPEKKLEDLKRFERSLDDQQLPRSDEP